MTADDVPDAGVREDAVRADVVQADGAPGPTLVLDRAGLPPGALALRSELTALQGWLARTGRTDIKKIAFYGASPHPAYDLDYRFVQCLPGGGFDFRSGCGHSLLACVVGAGRTGTSTRVRVVNTGTRADALECEPAGDGTTYTVHFDRTPPTPPERLLPTGSPVDRIGGLRASLVAFGNPYVFVDAAELGLAGRDELFGAGTEDFVRLLRLRAVAARLLGLPARGALPKIAAVGAYEEGRLAVRALTVPGWHPALALTGTTCLAAATAVPGTVPHLLARRAGCLPEVLRVDTPGGTVTATVTTTAATTVATGPAAADAAAALRRVSVHGKRARILERAVVLPWRTHVTA